MVVTNPGLHQFELDCRCLALNRLLAEDGVGDLLFNRIAIHVLSLPGVGLSRNRIRDLEVLFLHAATGAPGLQDEPGPDPSLRGIRNRERESVHVVVLDPVLTPVRRVVGVVTSGACRRQREHPHCQGYHRQDSQTPRHSLSVSRQHDVQPFSERSVSLLAQSDRSDRFVDRTSLPPFPWGARRASRRPSRPSCHNYMIRRTPSFDSGRSAGISGTNCPTGTQIRDSGTKTGPRSIPGPVFTADSQLPSATLAPPAPDHEE